MSNFRACVFSVFPLVVAPATIPHAYPGQASAEQIVIRLRLYPHANTGPRVISEATKWADGIFREIGIQTDWRICPTTSSQLAENRSCSDPLKPLDFVIRILPPAMSKKYGLPDGVFGFAQPGNDGRAGRIASVFHAQIEDMAYSGAIPGPVKRVQGIILGHVLAHEVGHLILGARSHARNGIMSFPWGQQELLDASQRRLDFTERQAAKIRRLLTR